MVLSKLFTRFSRADRNKTSGNNHVAGQVIGDKGKLCQCRILLLDDTEYSIDARTGAKGQLILNNIFDHLNLLEKDYFGLRYLDETNQTHWLEPTKNIGSQLKSHPPHTLYFGVKFYAADPCKLHEEITRYQFFLQLKKDILQGRLPVQFDLASELSALAVQSELGDFDPKRHSYGYVSEFRFIPNQTEEFEDKVMGLHKTIVGLVPSSVEYKYLDRAKWLDMYGVDLHPVQGEGNLEYFLGLTPTGIVVYRNKQKVGNYFWPRLSKVTFKGKMFMVRVKDKNNEENTYAFDCASKPACKHLWKCCIEHHAFFRLTSASESYKATGKLFSLGSKHRYSGRTEKQALADGANRPQPKVVRRPSRRHQRRDSVESMPNGFRSSQPADSEFDHAIFMGPDHEPQGRDRGYQSAPESPRSTRSAPWEPHRQKRGGLFTSGRESPTSLASERMMFPRRQYESESEGGPKRRNHKSRMDPSDSEAESMYHRTARCRVPAEYTEASESESEYRSKHRKYRKSAENLAQHENNWQEMQRRIREGGFQGPLVTAQARPHSGSMTSMASGESNRRRRRRSKSPGNRKPPEELAEHFKYVDPDLDGIPSEMMIDIPYTTVETESNQARIKEHAHRRHRSKSPKTQKNEMFEKAGSAVGSITGSLANEGSRGHRNVNSYRSHKTPYHQSSEFEGPPPYSEQHQQNLHPPIQPTTTYTANQRGVVASSKVQHSNIQYAQHNHIYSTNNHQQQHGPGQYKPSHVYGHSQPDENETMRSPVHVQRNEAYTAPIVKTNTAKNYNINSTYNQAPPYTLTGQSMYSSNKQTSGQGFHDHMREDSGLGIESNNSSNTSAGTVLYPDQYYDPFYQSAQGSPASYTQHSQPYTQTNNNVYSEQGLSKASYGSQPPHQQNHPSHQQQMQHNGYGHHSKKHNRISQNDMYNNQYSSPPHMWEGSEAGSPYRGGDKRGGRGNDYASAGYYGQDNRQVVNAGDGGRGLIHNTGEKTTEL